MSTLDAIRKRVEAQRSRYGARWNQILKDRAWLLAEIDRLNAEKVKDAESEAMLKRAEKIRV